MSKPPNKADIIAWISANPMQIGRRDIAKAFGIKGSGKIKLKRILKEMESEGVYGGAEKDNQAMLEIDSQLPPVSVLSVAEIDENGDLFATPVDWQREDTPPRILMAIGPEAIPLGVGDQILARVTPISDQEYQYEAKLIRRKEKAQIKTLGVYRLRGAIGRIVPIDKSGKEWRVATADANGAKDGELVEAVRSGSNSRLGLQRARVVRRLGNPSAPKAVSLIAIHQHNIPDTFSEQVLEEARVSGQRKLVEHEDLCHLPFVTIDPEGARDHDDAVFAQADSDRDNMGGHLIWVAIADVAHYVRPGTALNEAARKRGNSTYFPDRVVPMLPEALSADLCSLHQGAKRPCLVVCLKIDSKGKKINHEFHRAIICSVSSLTYEEVQRGIDGAPSDRVSALLDTVIRPLYAAYSSLCFERQERQPLDLELPERVICLGKNGDVTSVKFKDRLDAHRLIEEFMIMANVAAAECLAAKKEPCLFRIHEEPDKEKIEALRDTAQSVGLNLAKGAALRTRHLNQLLRQAEEQKEAELLSMSTLRAMTQAYYSMDNFGHFGLALQAYAHFTSPIRRYADLVVHRALIRAHKWGEGGLTHEEEELLSETASQISISERRSMSAERDTLDRYLAIYLSEKIGNEFSGRISGVVKFGVFVRLDGSGAEGLVPVRSLGREYFTLENKLNRLVGTETGLKLSLGQNVSVRLTEVTSESGGIIFELLNVEGLALPSRRGGKSRPRKRGVHINKRASKKKRNKAP